MATFEKYCKEANMKVFAFMFMDNCDQVKYSSILQALIRKAHLVTSNIQKAYQRQFMCWVTIVLMLTNKRNPKGIQQKSKRIKTLMKLQNLLLFKWNGYVSVASQGGYKKRPNEKWAIK